MQRRSGTDGKGLRLKFRPTNDRFFFLFVLTHALGGCAGVLGYDGTSASVGWHAGGSLRHPVVLPFAGEGYLIPSPWRERQSNFGTEELVAAIVRATRSVEKVAPGALAPVGDLSRRGGGGSVEHKSHQSGRDVDIFYYGIDRAGRPMATGNVMVRFDRMGRAFRWSPPQGTPLPARAVPDLRFDVRRNWQLVRALLTDAEVEVQWIFVQRDLAVRLLQEGVAQGDDAALLARATQIMRQPTDAEAHDDHMHVRIYCQPQDRSEGCDDRGPLRWWKKNWKYMTPPFGRGADASTAGALLGLLRTRVPIWSDDERLTS